MKQAVFLDRDGVLLDPILRGNKAYAPLTLNQFRITDDAAAQIDRLRTSGLLCILFTNQPDVARGDLSHENLNEMHRILRSQVMLDDLFVCTHDSNDGCPCRKPRPGMILEAAKKWNIDLPMSCVIGDRWCDIEAGRAVGCYSVLIKRLYSECTTSDACATNLTEAVDITLKKFRDLS